MLQLRPPRACMCIPASGHISEHQNRCLQPPSWTDRPQPDGIGIGIGIRSYGPTSAHSSAPCTLRAPLSCSDNLSRVEKVSPYIRLLASISHDALQLIFIFSILSRFICPQQDLLILQNPPDSGLQSRAESATYCPSACQPHFYRLWGGVGGETTKHLTLNVFTSPCEWDHHGDTEDVKKWFREDITDIRGRRLAGLGHRGEVMAKSGLVLLKVLAAPGLVFR